MEFYQYIYGSFPDQIRAELDIISYSSGIDEKTIRQIKKIYQLIGDKTPLLRQDDLQFFLYHVETYVIFGVIDYNTTDMGGRQSRRSRGVLIPKGNIGFQFNLNFLKNLLNLSEVDNLRKFKNLPKLSLTNELMNLNIDTETKQIILNAISGNRIELPLNIYESKERIEESMQYFINKLNYSINISTYTNSEIGNHDFNIFGTFNKKSTTLYGENKLNRHIEQNAFVNEAKIAGEISSDTQLNRRGTTPANVVEWESEGMPKISKNKFITNAVLVLGILSIASFGAYYFLSGKSEGQPSVSRQDEVMQTEKTAELSKEQIQKNMIIEEISNKGKPFSVKIDPKKKKLSILIPPKLKIDIKNNEAYQVILTKYKEDKNNSCLIVGDTLLLDFNLQGNEFYVFDIKKKILIDTIHKNNKKR